MIRNALVFLILLVPLVFSACSNSTEAAPSFQRENPLFAKLSEPILGLHVVELQEMIGLPDDVDKKGCMARATGSVGLKSTNHIGDKWIYTHAVGHVSVELNACVLNGYVVTETKTWTVVYGSTISVSVELLSDTDITADAARGRMNGSREERTGLYSGRKIEV